VVALLAAPPDRCFFWATHAGTELDLMILHGRKKIGFEFKRTDAPATTKSMRHALTDLHLAHLYVIHPGRQTFPLDRNVTALALSEAQTHLRALT
jgi:predicted AAA+ superfamily ATPase